MTTDPISYERGDAHTRASLALTDGDVVTGPWGAGDLQATRNLVILMADLLEYAKTRRSIEEDRVNRMSGDMRRVRTQLREALNDNEHLRFDLEAAKNRNEGLQAVVNVREQEIAAILGRLDRSHVDLLIELTQLRVQADGGRWAANEQLLKDAVAQRQEAQARVAALEMQIEVLKDHNARLNADLRHAEEQLASPDPWYDDPGVAVEWGTQHTLISHDGIEAEPITMNMGADRAKALERYHQWRTWGMADQVRIELVRRVINRGQWITVPVPQPKEVDDAVGAVAPNAGADLSTTSEC